MSAIAAYAWEQGRTKQVVYLDGSGHVHELFVPVGGTWAEADLTQITGAPPANLSSFIAGYGWKAGGTKQVAYLTEDGHTHELFVSSGGTWTDADLTQITGAILHGPFAGYGWEAGGSKQLTYLDDSLHARELFVPVGGSWGQADLTRIADATPAFFGSSIVGYGWEAGGSKQVVYLTEDGHIHELFVSSGDAWGHADLTDITGAPVVASVIIP